MKKCGVFRKLCTCWEFTKARPPETKGFPSTSDQDLRASVQKTSHLPGMETPGFSKTITEAGRELADPAGVAASAIRRMSPFWFFLELWDFCHPGTGSGPGGGGQTSFKLMYGRSPGEVRQACVHLTFGLTLALPWGSGFELISGPFRRRFRDSFWS